ncbi:hypothetical protein [Streptomyces tubercidicus]|uniref:hypothetical protein n=1 Tax=Streptomyces tubercidicus TaxID=47759 RepID=UPI00369DE6A9
MGDLQAFRLDDQTDLLASREDPTHQVELGVLAALKKNHASAATAITRKAAWNKQQAPPLTRTETAAPRTEHSRRRRRIP